MRRTPPPGRSGQPPQPRLEEAEPVLQELEQVIEQAQATLEDPQAQEADLRDRLYELRRACETAEPFWLIIDISRTTAFKGAVKEAKDRLLARAKALNPQITSWEKAIDPACRVSEITTRSGKKKARPFQPPIPLLKVLQGQGAGAQTAQEEDTAIREGEPSTGSRRSQSALRVPVEPHGSEILQTQQQPPVGATSTRNASVDRGEDQPAWITQSMLKDIQETVAGMKQFLSRAEAAEEETPRRSRRTRYRDESEDEREEDDRTDPLQLEHLRRKYRERTRCTPTPHSVLPKSPWATASDPQPRPASFKSMREQRTEPKLPFCQTKTRRPYRYALDQEDDDEAEDEEYFRTRYEQENEEAEEIDLGPYFVYPSKKTFEKYFGEFDFIKHVRHGTLSKFDGTVKGYPAFRKNFYELVYVQRVGYLHKLMALEYMVPEKIQKELFGDLDNSAAHFGRRIKRLEQRFGGQDRQEQYLIEVLTEAKTRAAGRRLPYQELLELARHVDSHLAKGFRFTGTSDPILVHLRDLVPHHIKTAFSMEMLRCGAEETGKAFLKYLLDAVRVEMRAQESNPKRGEGDKTNQQDKNKMDKPKVLGKLYKAKGKAQRRRSSSSSGSEENTPKVEGKVTDTEAENTVYTGLARPKTVEPQNCSCCGEGAHFLYNCYKFVHEYGVQQKRRFAETDGRCFRCLRAGHLRAACLGREIECRFCKKTDHHYLLCVREGARVKEQGEVKVANAEENQTMPNNEQLSYEALGEAVTKKRVTPLQMILHVLDQKGRVVKINAMPDTGSTHNIVELENPPRVGSHRGQLPVLCHGTWWPYFHA